MFNSFYHRWVHLLNIKPILSVLCQYHRIYPLLHFLLLKKILEHFHFRNLPLPTFVSLLFQHHPFQIIFHKKPCASFLLHMWKSICSFLSIIFILIFSYRRCWSRPLSRTKREVRTKSEWFLFVDWRQEKNGINIYIYVSGYVKVENIRS